MFNFILFIMAKNSVLGSPSTVARLPHQGFNPSHKLKFTSSTGHLLPVLFDYLRPGERVRLNYDLFTRTQPLESAAMVDIDEFVDFFFVPMRKMYNNFDLLVTSIDDFSSILFQENADDSLNTNPMLDLASCMSGSSSIKPADNEDGIYGVGFDKWYFGAGRLLDLLSYEPNVLFGEWEGTDVSYNVPELYFPALSPFALLAYQAIYFDYYRSSNWEKNDVAAYNVDDFRNNDVINRQRLTSARLKSMLQLRYRCYQRDFFHAIEPSPLLSPVGTFGLSGYHSMPELRQWLGLDDDLSAVNGMSQQPSGFGDTATNTVLFQSESDMLSLSSLRTAYAFERLLKITNRAGKHYDDQILAHFGVKVPRGISNEVYYLGGGHNQLKIGEVISTADTYQGNDDVGRELASIAGKGYGAAPIGKMQDINFQAPCDGILMAIYSCTPKLSYVTGIDRLHTRRTRFDYPQPETRNLGAQPLFVYQAKPMDFEATARLAWQPRYMESKMKFDRATHNFLGFNAYGSLENNVGSEHSWTLAQIPYATAQYVDFGQFQDYLLCKPTDLNDIMVMQYRLDYTRDYLAAGIWYNRMYQRDPLIHDIFFKYFKTSFMSTFGYDDVDV